MSAPLESVDAQSHAVDAPALGRSLPAVSDTPPTTTPRPIPDDALILLAVRGTVLFPETIFPLNVERKSMQEAVQEAVRLERPIGVVLQSKPDVIEPGASDLHEVGTSAIVLRYLTGTDDMHRIVVKGVRRFRIVQMLEGYRILVAKVQYVDDPQVIGTEVEGRARALKQSARETLALLPQVPAELGTSLQGI